MSRKLAAGLSAAVVLATLAIAVPATQAAPRALHCELSGTAYFTPGLKVRPASGKYSFAGKLFGCRSNANSRLKRAKIEATGGGTTGCGFGITKGTAKLTWNTGKVSVVRFETYSVAAGVSVVGQVRRSTERGIKKGDRALAGLEFTADPAKCNTSRGVRSAHFEGHIAGGAPN